MNISPFLSINHSCDETLSWSKERLVQAGLHAVQTFDLHAARAGSHDCSCPNHGTEECDCQMDDLGGAKMIAYPWNSIDVPLVMTSWGRIQKFETFDVEQARNFYRANLNKAPEPNAP